MTAIVGASEDAITRLPATGEGGAKILRHISLVTHCVPDLQAVVSAWCRHLGYEPVEQGRLPAALCALWNAPGATESPYCILRPASGAASCIRFVQTADPGGYGPPMTCGWNATELLVQDVDGLARQFVGAGFTVLGGPADLYARARAPRAMQVRGPSGELIYFTRLLPGGSRYGLKGAQSPVDRVFIVTVGGRSGEVLHRFYGDILGQRILDRTPFINTILAHGCGAPPDTLFPTSVARIPGRSFLVEMDQYPVHVADRARRPGHLPPGMAMVSFRVQDLDAVPVPFRHPPARIDGFAYDGRRVAVIEGPAGEWLELIEGDGP